MESLLFRKRVAAIASIVLTTGAWLAIASSPSAFATAASPSALNCPPGSDYISLHGYQIRSKVLDITNPAPGLQHGRLACGEHAYRLERTKSGSTWQEWHNY
jgi:hypothetical protein